jgi:hypothetical protein
MGGDPVRITASKGALKRGGSTRATSILLWIENQILLKTAVT